MLQPLQTFAALHAPGTLVCVVIALAATFVSEHYGGPQLLYALLMGLAFHFLADHPKVGPGIAFCGRTVLRVGVALLGVRITLAQVSELGWASALLVLLAVVCTIAVGVLLAHWLKRPRDEGVLSGCAVAICGASAAMAVASVLPQTKANERFTLLTVVGVTVLSTVSMVLYPFLLQVLGASPEQSGLFLGGTIHDVAQVVAAGMMLGPQAADTATVVKLFRVMLLMPIVLAISVLYVQRGAAAQIAKAKDATPLVPGFLLAFILLMLMTSAQLFSPAQIALASNTSRWLLVTAIAAAGVKTSFEDLLQLGWRPVILLVGETAAIAGFVLVGLWVMG